MSTGFRNTLMNPGFDFWDYGVGPFAVAGYTSTRWKLALAGAPVVSVTKGTTSSSLALPKWLRGQSNLTIAVNTYTPATDDITIQQRVDIGGRLGERRLALSIVAAGPAGASFSVSIDGTRHRIYTKGLDGGGEDILTHACIYEVIDAVATSDMPIEIFAEPSGTGTFKVMFAQLEFTDGIAAPFELRTRSTERMLLSRYIHPIGRGLFGIGDGATGFLSSVRFPTEMRVNPTWRPILTSNITINDLSSGGVVNAATPTYTVTLANTFGARVKITGFTATTAIPYMLSSEIGFFDADY